MDTAHHWPRSNIMANVDKTPQVLAPDCNTDGVITIDEEGRLILCNEAGVRHLGYGSAAEIVGSHAIVFLPVPEEVLWETTISQHPLLSCARGEMGTAQMEGTFLRADGTGLKVRYRIEPIWLDWSRRGAVCTFSEIKA